MSRQNGFTYLAVLFMVAIAGIVLAANGTVWSSVKAREDAEQLKFVGDQFRQAIRSYYEQSPGGIKQYPRRLEDLLKDNRFPESKRHLRKLYVNPHTSKADWESVSAPDGGVMGIAVSAPETAQFLYLPPSIQTTAFPGRNP